MDIKVVNHGYPNQDNEEVGVVEQKVTFIQHSDTCDKDRYQYLSFETVGVDFDPKDNTDSFLRVSTGDKFAYNENKTDVAQFWSCNGPEELVRMFNEAARRFGMSCRWKLEKYHVRPIADLVKEEVISEEELEQIKSKYDEERRQRMETIQKRMREE